MAARVKLRFLLVLLVFGGVPSAPPPPTHARALWVSEATARLSWEQESSANIACLSSLSGAGTADTIETCIASARGTNIVDLVYVASPYGVYFPTMNDSYYITEWYYNGAGHTFYGRYGPFVLERAQDLYLPLVVR